MEHPGAYSVPGNIKLHSDLGDHGVESILRQGKTVLFGGPTYVKDHYGYAIGILRCLPLPQCLQRYCFLVPALNKLPRKFRSYIGWSNYYSLELAELPEGVRRHDEESGDRIPILGIQFVHVLIVAEVYDDSLADNYCRREDVEQLFRWAYAYMHL